MECNKDEAIRAKEVAEKKFMEKDIAGAKRFASKAQSLFPGLEGISQFQETLDVHVASEKKVNGEIDWYEILGVDPLADDETIRKRYRKLALSLHPDKNKSVGADGAFNILCKAWSLLSDKTQRAAYNEKRNIRASNKQVRHGNPPVGAGKRSYNTFSSSLSAKRNVATPDNPPTDYAPSRANPNTFWTSCKICMMQYEYMAVYRNQNLICPNCHKPFLATEMPPPPVKGRTPSTQLPFFRQKQGANHTANNTSSHSRKFTPTPNMGTSKFPDTCSMSRVNDPRGSSSKSSGARSMSTSTMATDQPAQSFQLTSENLKRGHEEAVTGALKEEALPKKSTASKKSDIDLASENVPNSGKGEMAAKRRRVNEHKRNAGEKGMAYQMPPGGGHSGQVETSGSQMGGLGSEKVVNSGSNKHKISRDLSHSDVRNVLTNKARMEILKKLNDFGGAATSRSSGKEGKNMEKEISNNANATQESIFSGMKKEENMNVAFDDTNTSVQPTNSLLVSVTSDSDAKVAETMLASVPDPAELVVSSLSSATPDSAPKVYTESMTMNVPDPDFHDFEMDRSEGSFAENQVWATYGNEDAMPRLYALISQVITENIFKLKIKWLYAESNSELGPLNLVGDHFSNPVGYFRIGKRKFVQELNSFSHKVKCTKGARGIYDIFPRKGDVWALYRNWSSDWNDLTPDDVIREYDVVEVIEDYNEEKGVCVTPLVKVAGFKSVFHRHLDPREIYTIPTKEMFRFSHQVPAYLLTGQEGEKAPKGFLELDPAALSLELLQVMEETEEGDVERIQKGVGVEAEVGEEKGKAEEMHAEGDGNASRNEDSKHAVIEQIMTYSSKMKAEKVVGDTIESWEEVSLAAAN